MEKTRQEIAEQLRAWHEQGLINSKAQWKYEGKGNRYANIDRLLSKGIINHTSISTIVVAPEISDEFEKLVSDHRVMGTNVAYIRFGIKNTYEINAYCATGKLMKFSDFGRSAVLFID